MGILFNRTALGIHLCKTSQLCILKTRLGGEIYSSDVNMHKGYCLSCLPVKIQIRPAIKTQTNIISGGPFFPQKIKFKRKKDTFLSREVPAYRADK